jgi:hypothetical protein
MKKEFCSYEISLKLKELGFDETCLGMFIPEINGKVELEYNGCITNNEMFDKCIAAPLWQQVWSFLDSKGVIIGIIFVDNVFKYTLNIENYVSNGFKNRTEAITSATEYATNYLWNKKSNK